MTERTSNDGAHDPIMKDSQQKTAKVKTKNVKHFWYYCPHKRIGFISLVVKTTVSNYQHHDQIVYC